MKLDVTIFRYMTRDDFRVLTAIEMGSKNHYLVPVPLIETIAQLKRGGCRKVLSNLLKNKLIAHDSKKYDGYKLTYNGYDFLALKALVNRGHIGDVGIRIGVGKEADIHVAYSPEGKKLALKLHRLGRVSFKSIKNNRDYLQHRKHASWMYMARLAATKEYAYNKALADAGFRVPQAVDHNRHAILMEFVDAMPLVRVRYLKHPLQVMERLFRVIVRLGKAGLIHGDFNEFNLMINEKEEITVIDFPQIVTMDHLNADYYFMRDVNCIKAFFRKRFEIETETWPTYKEVEEGRQAGLKDASSSASKESGEESAQLHIGRLMERRDDDLLLQAIQEEVELEEQAEKEDAEEGDESEDDAEAPQLTEQLGQLAVESDSEEEMGEEDLDAIINKAMARRRMMDDGYQMPESEEEGESEGEEEEEEEEEEAVHEKPRRGGGSNAVECMSPLRLIRENVARQIYSPETEDGAEEDSDADSEGAADADLTATHETRAQRRARKEKEKEAAMRAGEDLDNVPQVQDQIHVLRRKKKEVLTPAQVREKMKNKAKQQRIRDAGKNKGKNRKKNDEFKSACADFGV